MLLTFEDPPGNVKVCHLFRLLARIFVRFFVRSMREVFNKHINAKNDTKRDEYWINSER